MDQVIEVEPPALRTAPTYGAASPRADQLEEVIKEDLLDALVEEYAEWMRSWSAAERTIKQRTAFAERVITAWGGGPTVDKIQAFLADPAWSAFTRRTYHAHVSSLCKWLFMAEWIDVNPMASGDVIAPRRPPSEPRPLSEAEVARVLEAAQGRIRDWILLALLAGLRIHEIAKLRGEDVTEEGLYVDGKGGKRTTLPIHPDLWEMAQRYPRTGYWFPTPNGGHTSSDTMSMAVGRLFHSLGIEGSIHRCRHTYGTRLLRAGANIRVVQKLMRHASLQTTAGYMAVDEAEMSAAIRLLPGDSGPADPI
jgi:integrase